MRRPRATIRDPKALRDFVIAVGIVLLALFAVFAFTQERPFTPWNPILLEKNNYTSPDIWIAGVYGEAYTDIQGPHQFSGLTLQLGIAPDQIPASANWSVPFDDAAQFKGILTNYTLYIPGQLLVSQPNTPLTVTVDGHSFIYQPTNATKVWWSPTTLYAPSSQDLHPLPANFQRTGGNYQYLTFSFSARSIPSQVKVTVSVPAGGQIYVPNVVFQGSLNYSSYVHTTSQDTGLVILPVLGVLVGLVMWVVWKLDVVRYLGVVVAGCLVRIAVAPWFMHPDVVTLIRYPTLLYNHSFLDFLSFTYGLTWFGQILVTPSLFYALGINPSLASYDMLMKLPALGADVITFLLLIKVLSQWTTPKKAVFWASAGWFFNPLVIYYPYLHGLTETVVALMIAVGVFGFQHGRQGWGALGLAGAVLTISPMIFVYPLTLVTEGLRTKWKLFYLVVPPLIYGAIVLALYGSPTVLGSYFSSIVGRTTPSAVSFGAATLSNMTPLLELYLRTGVYLTPFLGLAFLFAISVVAYLKGLRFPRQALPYLAYLSLMVFYITYESFYVQHLVWIVPIGVALLVQAGVSLKRGTAYLLTFSILGLVVNFMAPRGAPVNPYLAMVLFGLAFVPLLLPFDWTRELCASLHTLGRAIPIIALGSALGLSTELMLGYSVPWIPKVALALTVITLVLRIWARDRKDLPGGDALKAVLEVSVMSFPLVLAFTLPTNLPSLSEWLVLILAVTAIVEQARWVRRFLVSQKVEAPNPRVQHVAGG